MMNSINAYTRKVLWLPLAAKIIDAGTVSPRYVPLVARRTDAYIRTVDSHSPSLQRGLYLLGMEAMQ